MLAIVSDCFWRNVTLWWEHQLGTLSSGDRFGVSKSVFPSEEQSKSRWRCCTTIGQRTRQRRHAATVVCFRKLRRDLRAATEFISRNMIFFSSVTDSHELLPSLSCLHLISDCSRAKCNAARGGLCDALIFNRGHPVARQSRRLTVTTSDTGRRISFHAMIISTTS